jgi:hypothetical protein
MPTANSASPSTAKPAARRAGTTRAKAGTRTKAASTARTRAAASTPRSASARSTSVGAGNTGYAERAVLIPLGAALIARDQLVASVNDTISSYASPSKAQTQLRRFERRGATARNRLEREVRKTRTRVEREVRQRRREGSDFANRLQERVLNLV